MCLLTFQLETVSVRRLSGDQDIPPLSISLHLYFILDLLCSCSLQTSLASPHPPLASPAPAPGIAFSCIQEVLTGPGNLNYHTDTSLQISSLAMLRLLLITSGQDFKPICFSLLVITVDASAMEHSRQHLAKSVPSPATLSAPVSPLTSNTSLQATAASTVECSSLICMNT